MASFVDRNGKPFSNQWYYMHVNEPFLFGVAEPTDGEGQEVGVDVNVPSGTYKLTRKELDKVRKIRKYELTVTDGGDVWLFTKTVTAASPSGDPISFGPIIDTFGITAVWKATAFVLQKPVSKATRQAVVDLALMKEGCHYLWGAAGASPGLNDGMPSRQAGVRMEPDRFDLGDPCVRAAWFDTGEMIKDPSSKDPKKKIRKPGTKHICAGRCDNAPKIALMPDTLKNKLDGWRIDPTSLFSTADRVFPRKIIGYSVHEEIVWGENCMCVQHFDCVGLVNYCLSMVLKAEIQDSIEGWNRTTRLMKKGSPVEPADILTQGDHHIGFATGDGRVVQAAETKQGVIVGKFNEDGWERRGRLLSSD